MCVCVYTRSLLHSVRFGQLLRCAHKRVVNRIKVYIERSNMQVELIRFRKKKVDFIHVYVCESRNSMQCRSPNPILESSSCQTVSVVIRLNTIGYNGVFAPLPGATLPIQQVRCHRSPNYAIKLCRLTHCKYNESVHQKEQLATRINTIQ